MTHQVYLSDGLIMCEPEFQKSVLARRLAFNPTSFFDIWGERTPKPLYRTETGVAIISVEGFLDEKESIELSWIGGTAYETIIRAITAAVNDSNIRGIVLDVTSGGGVACGSSDCAAGIRRLRGKKPIVTIANSFMCSAALEVATAADEVTVTSGAMIGSIGCIFHRLDVSAYEAKLGIKTHIFKAGAEKGFGDPSLPMSDEEQTRWQGIVNWFYDQFTNCVAENYGVAQSHVLEKWADARLFLGHQAVDAGLATRVTTLPQLVAELGSQSSSATQKGTSNHAQRTTHNANRIRPGSRLVPRPQR